MQEKKFINTLMVGEEDGRKEGKWEARGRGRDFPNCLVTGKVKSSSYEVGDRSGGRLSAGNSLGANPDSQALGSGHYCAIMH